MPDYADLIATIYRYGGYRSEGQLAINALVAGGEPAFDAFLIAQTQPPESDIHGRDLAETINDVIGQFSKAMPDVVLDRLESGQLDEFETYWALGNASGDRSVDVLISGLKSKDKFCRWAAADSLIRHKSTRATPALIEALKDRSSDVKFAVVSTMQKWKQLRRPEAIPALKRIVASNAVLKHSPGLHKAAEAVIKLIERENRS
jgi:hypothetical protein